MRQAKTLLVVCLGILALALAYHFGATTATAQAPGNAVVGAFSGGGSPFAMIGGAVTANGDFYATADYVHWTQVSNIFSGATPAQSISIGQLKARYAK